MVRAAVLPKRCRSAGPTQKVGILALHERLAEALDGFKNVFPVRRMIIILSSCSATAANRQRLAPMPWRTYNTRGWCSLAIHK